MKIVKITYENQEVYVNEEVAVYLEICRKQEQAQKKRDQRHLAFEEVESLLTYKCSLNKSKDFVDEIITEWERQRIRKAILGLPVDQQRLILCRYYKKMTLREMSRQEGVPMQTIHNRLKKVIKILSKMI